MFNDSEKKLLADNGFLVESNEKELQEITTKLNDKEKNEMRLIIFPTMQCNFRCTYCYEDKTNINLNDKKNCLGKLNEFDNINDDIWTRYKYEECPNCEIFPLCLGKMCKYDNLDTFKKCRDKHLIFSLH